ncbi:MAG: YciI family protein [Myxococcota bacterium]
MPVFAFIGHDGPRGAELRKQHRPAHLAGLEGLAQAGRIVHAGPLLDEDGAPVGSLVLFEADDLASARAVAARDPYVVEGVFERHAVNETRVVFPR